MAFFFFIDVGKLKVTVTFES